MRGRCFPTRKTKITKAANEELLTFGWWNGGGGVRKRLSVNPGLKEFIATQPDIWAYCESGITNSQSLSLEGYNYFFHRSYLRDKSKFRRGMVLFYRQQHAQEIAKVFSSIKFDIVWLRLATRSGLIFICFFYAPGAHHEEGIRSKFYNTLCTSYEKFCNLGHVIMLCDSNARLGKYTNDRNIHGNHIENNNCNLFYWIFRVFWTSIAE